MTKGIHAAEIAGAIIERPWSRFGVNQCIAFSMHQEVGRAFPLKQVYATPYKLIKVWRPIVVLNATSLCYKRFTNIKHHRKHRFPTHNNPTTYQTLNLLWDALFEDVKRRYLELKKIYYPDTRSGISRLPSFNCKVAQWYTGGESQEVPKNAAQAHRTRIATEATIGAFDTLNRIIRNRFKRPWQRLLPSSMIFDSKQKVLGGIFGGESDVENAGEPFGSGSMAQFSRGALLVASSTRFPVD
ncbi:hypothetical protein M408DRAFT_11074 [Serendipita vermifera MAFF 305830]|uniref:Uncharacterized protein n=1 Tax=Serendipita vermifera MAFF 305830 TaxID=933852 RepID=A0A0C2WCY7_SERVB|nr:hypothetical protein M408DRAFT_11074 [Serendipita vermifera MAFF 305830]